MHVDEEKGSHASSASTHPDFAADIAMEGTGSSLHSYREHRLYPADSSSPLRNSSPPSSPLLSPTPHPFFGRNSSRSSDPFAANVKADTTFGSSGSHLAIDGHGGSPSNDRQKRAKAARGKKRSYPVSPQKGVDAFSGKDTDAIMHDDDDATAAVRALPTSAASRVLGSLFSEGTSSEDHNSSDDQLEWGIGLKGDRRASAAAHQQSGLAPAFELSRRGPPPFPSSGSTGPSDPLSAFGQPPSRTFSRNTSGPVAQRRRLVGTSPKQLSRATNGHNVVDSSGDEAPLPSWEQREIPKPSESFWQAKVSQVWDKNEARLILDGMGLDAIHPVIADLSKYVHLLPSKHDDDASSTFSRTSSFARSSSFARTSSRTGNEAGLEGSPKSPSAKLLTKTLSQAETKAPQLYLSNNSLSRLPSALFHIQNLTVLTLRNNKLKVLPCAIGELSNLRELNVAGNELRYLPAEILKLRLVNFIHFPNPFLQAPSEERLSLRPSLGATGRRLLGALEYPKTKEVKFAPTATPAPPSSSSTLMGPPALPTRLLSQARTFQRTRSDVQMDELLESGLSMLGTPYLGSNATSRTSSSAAAGPSATTSNTSATGSALAASAAARLFGARSVSFAHAPSRKDVVARSNNEAREAALRAELEEMDATETRAHHLSETNVERPLPSLWECCMRMLLSPAPADEDSNTLGTRGSSQPSSPLAALHASSSGSRRAITLLESYEGGTLRTLQHTLDVRSARALECARRSLAGAWGGASSTSVPSFSRGSSSGGSSGLSSRTISEVKGRTTDRHNGGKKQTTSSTWMSGAQLSLSRTDDEDGGGYSSTWSDYSDDRPLRRPKADAESKEMRSSPTSSPIRSSPPASGSTVPRIPAADMEADLAQGDDAVENPYFSRCPNPQHAKREGITWSASSASTNGAKSVNGAEGPRKVDDSGWADWPLPLPLDSGRDGAGRYRPPVFVQPAETRLEWVSHIGGYSVARSNVTAMLRTAAAPNVATAAPAENVEGPAATANPSTEVAVDASKTPSTMPLVRESQCLPILWRGCSRGCLEFLEHPQLHGSMEEKVAARAQNAE